MLPSQLFELADDVHYSSFDNRSEQEELTRIAYAFEYEDNAHAITSEDLGHQYVNARRWRREYFA